MTSTATPLERQAERVRASLQFGAVYLAAIGLVAAVAWWWSGLGIAAASDAEDGERRRKHGSKKYASVAAKEVDCGEADELISSDQDQLHLSSEKDHPRLEALEPSLDPAFVAAATAMAPAARATTISEHDNGVQLVRMST